MLRRDLRVLLAVFMAPALGVTFWTWLVFECIPMEVSVDGAHVYTECNPPTTLGRLFINVVLVTAVSGATLLAAIVFRISRRAGRYLWRRARETRATALR